MRTFTFSSLLSLLLLWTPVIEAIYADEAYQSDYHHALLGTPRRQTTFFHRPSATSKGALLYTLSEKHVIGAINPKDGSLVWRQYLRGDNNTINTPFSFLKPLKSENAIVSAVGGTVKAWDAADGKLVWEWDTSGVVKGLEVLEIEGGNKDVIVLVQENGKGVVRRLGAANGQALWEHVDER